MRLKLAIMLHSILEGLEWPYDFLVTREDELLLFIRFLRRTGFRFIMARDYRQAQGRTACLTFDDGFLDNWSLLFPLMEREGVPFTIFVCRDFLEDHERLRPPGLRQPGYLSVGELKEMRHSGLVDVQSHSTTHTWWPVAPRVTGIFAAGGQARHPWLLWNRDPAAKPGWLQADYSSCVGLPVLENDRALRAVRLLLDEDRWQALSVRVRDESLDVEAANRLLREAGPALGRPECPEESARRYRDELEQTARFLEDRLGERPTVLCWPGGAHNATSLAIAREQGYLSTAKIGHGRDGRYMHRISPGNPEGRERFPWKHQRLTLACYVARFAWRGWREAGTQTRDDT